MQAEHNELITRIGPGTRLRRAAAQLLAAGRAGRRIRSRASIRAWPRARSRRCALLGQDLVLFRDAQRRVGPARSRLPASRRRPGVRPLRGRRPALPVPRLEVRRRRAAAWRRRPSRPARRCAQRVRQRSYPVARAVAASLFAWLGDEGTAPPPFPALRLLRRAGDAQLRVQGPVELQLAAGVRGRHRSRRILRSCTASCTTSRRWSERRLRPPVPQRQRRRRRRRALADDADHARVPPARDPLRARRRRRSALTALRPMTDAAHARARHPRDLPARPS